MTGTAGCILLRKSQLILGPSERYVTYQILSKIQGIDSKVARLDILYIMLLCLVDWAEPIGTPRHIDEPAVLAHEVPARQINQLALEGEKGRG